MYFYQENPLSRAGLQSFYRPRVALAAPVKHNTVNLLLASLLGNEHSECLGYGLARLRHFAVMRFRYGASCPVVNKLRIKVLIGTEHCQARPERGAENARANAPLP